MSAANDRDYVGQWFEIYRRLQEPTEIIFEIRHGEKIESFEFLHKNGDGIAALFKLSETKSLSIRAVGFNKTPKKQNAASRFLNILLFLYRTKEKTSIWPFAIEKCNTGKTPRCCIGFTTEETQILKKKAEICGASVNTLIFYVLDRLVQQKFNLHDRSWWIPVNMRPYLNLDTNNASLKKNYVSNFTLDISNALQLEDYQSKISYALKNQLHLATWFWQHLGCYVPGALIEKIARKNLNPGRYVGAFSNLGEWTSTDTESDLFFFVNPLRSHPVGAAAVIWNGKLNLSLRNYPTFNMSADEMSDFLKGWKNNLLRLNNEN